MTTYKDLRDYIRDNYADSVDVKATRVYDRIIDRAFRRMAKTTDWSFLLKMGRINLVAPYETGTVALTQDSKTVTLTGGTWPATMGTDVWHIIFAANNEVEFEVITRNSGTVIELNENWPFTAEAANGFTAYRRDYALPVRFRKFMWGEMENYWEMSYITPSDYIELRLRQAQYAGDPRWFTVFDQRLKFWPYASTIRVADFLYVAWPKLLSDAGVVDTDAIDWDENHLDLVFAAIDLEVARSWGAGAPEDIQTAVTMYQGELREAKGVDSERALTAMQAYGIEREPAPHVRWRREVPT